MSRPFDDEHVSHVADLFRQTIRGDKRPFTHSNKQAARRLFDEVLKKLGDGRG